MLCDKKAVQVCASSKPKILLYCVQSTACLMVSFLFFFYSNQWAGYCCISVTERFNQWLRSRIQNNSCFFKNGTELNANQQLQKISQSNKHKVLQWRNEQWEEWKTTHNMSGEMCRPYATTLQEQKVNPLTRDTWDREYDRRDWFTKKRDWKVRQIGENNTSDVMLQCVRIGTGGTQLRNTREHGHGVVKRRFF